MEGVITCIHKGNMPQTRGIYSVLASWYTIYALSKARCRKCPFLFTAFHSVLEVFSRKHPSQMHSCKNTDMYSTLVSGAVRNRNS